MTVSIKMTKTGMIDGRSKNRNDYYDSEEFHNRWFSDETIESIALDCDVTIEAVRKAAVAVRGYPTKTQIKRQVMHD